MISSPSAPASIVRHNPLPPTIVRLFGNRQPINPFLPLVRDISLHVNDFRDGALYPSLIINPYLQRIHISLAKTCSYIGSKTDIDSTLLSGCPWEDVERVLTSTKPRYLREIFMDVCLSLATRNEVVAFESVHLSRLITTFHHIQKLNALSLQIDRVIFVSLSMLPELDYLAISILDEKHLHFPELVEDLAFFPQLKDLDLHIGNVGTFVQVLCTEGAFQRLSSLKLRGSVEATTDIFPLFCAIQKHAALSQNLESLTVLTAYQTYEPSQCLVPPINYSMLEPLFSLRRFRVLIIEVDGIVDLDNATLARIGVGLPHLEVLALGVERPQPTKPRITLTGLIPFLSSCPCLRSLSLRVDATENISELSGSGSFPSFPNLVEFGCSASPIRSSQEVANFLRSLFPAVTRLSYCRAYDDEAWTRDHPAETVQLEEVRKWKVVQRLMNIMPN
ncbi:hypothetical protein C0995_012379 [Termitomyces sp. Mi166|nr:hypothetical protein C0995_012379 [Termitomyces sp. Mi166\